MLRNYILIDETFYFLATPDMQYGSVTSAAVSWIL